MRRQRALRVLQQGVFAGHKTARAEGTFVQGSSQREGWFKAEHKCYR